MKIAAAVLVAVAFLATGCMVRVPVGSRSGAALGTASPAEKCPPGHQWSDGQCHSRGKGHDKHGR
jgi:hypothetical protein